MDTPNDNARTLQSYQDKTDIYVHDTPPIDAAITNWLDTSLNLIPRTARILEVGSGFGRDAEYIRSRGYDLECSDAVPNFVSLLQQKGFTARPLNLLTDPIDPGYDLIIADAVLLHFTAEEAAFVAQKVHQALNPRGIFAVRMKRGDGPVWSDEKLGEPRYFYYWQPEGLQAMLTQCGFEWLGMSESYTKHNQASWMHIIARKI